MVGFLNRLSLHQLGAVALGGVFVISSVGLFLNGKLVRKWAAAEFYQDAVRVARVSPGVKHLIGEPMIDRKISMGSSSGNKFDLDRVFIKIPVKGPVGKGQLHVEAERTQGHGDLKLRRCLLQVTGTKELLPNEYREKKLVVYDEERHGDIRQYVAKPKKETYRE